MFDSRDDDTLARAKSLADAGKYDEAYELILGLTFELSSHSFLDFRTLCRDILLKGLRARFADLNVYPQRLTTDRELRNYKLKAREAFIVGLIDGTLTLDDILAVSPVDELDTLRALARLLDLGIIGIGHQA
jgi:hypothetical protein